MTDFASRLLKSYRLGVNKGDRFISYRKVGKSRHVKVVKVHKTIGCVPSVTMMEVRSNGEPVRGTDALDTKWRRMTFDSQLTWDPKSATWVLSQEYYRPLGASFQEEATPVKLVPGTVVDHGKCDKCKGIRANRNNAITSMVCPVPGCDTSYARCSQHGGEEGCRRSMHSHGAVFHTGVKVI